MWIILLNININVFIISKKKFHQPLYFNVKNTLFSMIINLNNVIKNNKLLDYY